jgi:hypothetical protein
MTVPPTRHTGHETGSKHHLVCDGISSHTRVVLGITCFTFPSQALYLSDGVRSSTTGASR